MYCDAQVHVVGGLQTEAISQKKNNLFLSSRATDILSQVQVKKRQDPTFPIMQISGQWLCYSLFYSFPAW